MWLDHDITGSTECVAIYVHIAVVDEQYIATYIKYLVLYCIMKHQLVE